VKLASWLLVNDTDRDGGFVLFREKTFDADNDSISENVLLRDIEPDRETVRGYVIDVVGVVRS